MRLHVLNIICYGAIIIALLSFSIIRFDKNISTASPHQVNKYKQ